MGGNYLSRIKLRVLDMLGRNCARNPEIRLLVSKLFAYYADDNFYLAYLIQSLENSEEDFTSEISVCLKSTHQAVRKQCISYLAIRKIPGFCSLLLQTYQQESSDIRMAILEYFYLFFGREELFSAVECLKLEKEPRLRGKLIRIIGKFPEERECMRIFRALRETVTDEREWHEYVQVLKEWSDWKGLMQLPRNLPVVIRILIYESLSACRDYKIRDFLKDRFRKEEELVKIALLKIMPLDSENDVLLIRDEISAITPVFHRKIIGIIAGRNDAEIFEKSILNFILEEIRRKLVSIIRKTGDDQLLKKIVRFLRTPLNRDEKKGIVTLAGESGLSESERSFLLAYLELSGDTLLMSLLYELEKATFATDLLDYQFSGQFYLWLSFLLIKDMIRYELIEPFLFFSDCRISQEIVFYGCRSHNRSAQIRLMGIIRSSEKDRPSAIRLLGNFLDADLRKFLTYHFTSFDWRSRISTLELLSKELENFTPLLKAALADEKKEVVLRTVEFVSESPGYTRICSLIKPLAYSECPEVALSVLQKTDPAENRMEILKVLGKMDEKEVRKLLDPELPVIYGDDLRFAFFPVEDTGETKPLCRFFRENSSNPGFISKLMSLLNNELLPERLSSFSEAMAFCMIFISLGNAEQEALVFRYLEKSAVSREFVIGIRTSLEVSRRNILKSAYIDILENGGLKREYVFSFSGRTVKTEPDTELRRCAAGYPENRNSLLLKLGNQFFIEADYPQTVFYLKQIDNNRSDDLNYLIGFSYLKLGHLSAGLPFLEKITAGDDEEMYLDQLYQVAAELENRRDWRSALSFYQKLALTDLRFRDVSEKISRLEEKIRNLSVRGYPFDCERYTEVEEIGCGGMGEVFRAFDVVENRTVALKVLAKEHGGNQKIARRFVQRDGLVAMKLCHPGIVRIYDVVRDCDPPYIVMEYLEGFSLHDLISNSGPMQGSKIRDIFGGILDAMIYAHGQGIIHRDLKPDNIMVNMENQVKIMDFGLAKEIGATTMTQAGETFGTLYYMPPEQIRGAEVDIRADIYALGVILFELLTGKLPFSGENPEATMYQIFKKDPPRPSDFSLNLKGWDHLVQKALKKEPEERFQTCDEFKSAFVRL